VILISSELPEVMHLAHRVIVLRRGLQVAEFAKADLNAEAIVAAASGLDGSSAHAQHAAEAVAA
jgi:rhamnose transport system ATP-binding protein